MEQNPSWDKENHGRTSPLEYSSFLMTCLNLIPDIPVSQIVVETKKERLIKINNKKDSLHNKLDKIKTQQPQQF